MISERRTSTQVGVPRSSLDLIWETFFLKSGRGVDVDTHLPWLADSRTCCISLLNEDGSSMATAVVRPAPQDGVAMVGFVCVAEHARGRGLGRDLMDGVNFAIDEAGYHAALLWTGHPGFYEGCGYEQVGRDAFLRVSGSSIKGETITALTVSSWPGSEKCIGLPAFACSVKRLRTDRAEAIVADGVRGATLIGWQGAPSDVVAIMTSAGHESWNVNLPVGGMFHDALCAHGYEIEAEQGAFTMARRSRGNSPFDYVPVAERI